MNVLRRMADILRPKMEAAHRLAEAPDTPMTVYQYHDNGISEITGIIISIEDKVYKAEKINLESYHYDMYNTAYNQAVTNNEHLVNQDGSVYGINELKNTYIDRVDAVNAFNESLINKMAE